MSWDRIAVKWAEMVVRVQPNASERSLQPAPNPADKAKPNPAKEVVE